MTSKKNVQLKIILRIGTFSLCLLCYVFLLRAYYTVGWSEKNFFWKSKKVWFSNPGKWFKICFLGVATFFQPATPQNVFATDDAGGNS